MSKGLVGVSVRLTKEEIEFCSLKGDRSKYIRSLIEKDIKLSKLIHELFVKKNGHTQAT